MDRYYENINRLMLEQNAMDISIGEVERSKMESKIKELQEFVDSNTKPRPSYYPKINEENIQKVLLNHYHVDALRSLGTIEIKSIRVVYLHDAEVVRDVKTSDGIIELMIATGRPTPGAVYFGPEPLKQLVKCSPETFIEIGKFVHSNSEEFEFPAWETQAYGLLRVKDSLLTSFTEPHQSKPSVGIKFEMVNGLLYAASYGLLCESGETPVSVNVDVMTFPTPTIVMSGGSVNAYLSKDSDFVEHVNRFLDKSKNLEFTVKEYVRDLFTAKMLITVKMNNPAILNSLVCIMASRMKQITETSGTEILGIEGYKLDLSAEVNDKFIGEDLGMLRRIVD